MINILDREKKLHAVDDETQFKYLKTLYKYARDGKTIPSKNLVSIFYKIAISRIESEDELYNVNSVLFSNPIDIDNKLLVKWAKQYRSSCHFILEDEPLIKLGSIDPLDFDYDVVINNYDSNLILENKIQFHSIIKKLASIDDPLKKTAEDDATYKDALSLLFSEKVSWTWKLAFVVGIPLLLYGAWQTLAKKEMNGLLTAGLGALLMFGILDYMRSKANEIGYRVETASGGGARSEKGISRYGGREMQMPFSYEPPAYNPPQIPKIYRETFFYPTETDITRKSENRKGFDVSSFEFQPQDFKSIADFPAFKPPAFDSVSEFDSFAQKDFGLGSKRRESGLI